MRLLSKPAEYNFKEIEQYEQFRFFRLAIAQRNWVGNIYHTKKDASWFMRELSEADELFANILEKVESMSEIDILIDPSIFTGMEALNTTTIEFLEEFESIDLDDINVKEKIKLQKKLNYYASKPENWTQLYRWGILNEEHPLAENLIHQIDNAVIQLGIKSKNFLMQGGIKISKKRDKMKQQGVDSRIVSETYDSELVKLVTQCEILDSKNASDILKYTFKEPVLFLLGIHMIKRYFKQLDQVLSMRGKMFISLYKQNQRVEFFLKDSTELLDDTFLTHQAFIETLPKTKRNTRGTVKYYWSLHDVGGKEDTSEEDTIEILKTIVNWVSERIPENNVTILPEKSWIHYVKGDIFQQMGINMIRFEDAKVIGGPAGAELLLKTVAYASDERTIMFPVFSPNYWEGLTAKQCALIAYAICLYHDISIKNNYELVPHLDSEFKYELITKESKLSNLLENRHRGEKRPHKKTESTKEEHWVSFHFRRLRESQVASEAARQKARKYGIKELPKRFTFVDSFVKGKRQEEINNTKISALDVLNRTLKKINQYSENKIK